MGTTLWEDYCPLTEEEEIMFGKSLTEVEAIDRELIRLHDLMGTFGPKTDGHIWLRIVKLQDTLDEIARKNYKLEYRYA